MATSCATAEEAPTSEPPVPTDEIAQEAYGSNKHLPRDLGPVACDEAAVLAAIRADASGSFNPRPWQYSSMWAWAPSQPTCVKGTSAALATDYVRCSYDYNAGPTADGGISRMGETAYYYCATQRFRVMEGVLAQQVAGDTYLFQHRSGGQFVDQPGKPLSLCLSGIKLDGTPVANGRLQCFAGATPLRRLEGSLIGHSLGQYNSLVYRFAIFQENDTIVECGGAGGSCY